MVEGIFSWRIAYNLLKTNMVESERIDFRFLKLLSKDTCVEGIFSWRIAYNLLKTNIVETG